MLGTWYPGAAATARAYQRRNSPEAHPSRQGLPSFLAWPSLCTLLPLLHEDADCFAAENVGGSERCSDPAQLPSATSLRVQGYEFRVLRDANSQKPKSCSRRTGFDLSRSETFVSKVEIHPWLLLGRKCTYTYVITLHMEVWMYGCMDVCVYVCMYVCTYARRYVGR